MTNKVMKKTFLLLSCLAAVSVVQGMDRELRLCEQTRQLVFAAEDGDLARVKQLLDSGADVNGRGGRDFIPLHCAAEKGHLAVMEELLARGAEVNVSYTFHGGPLDFAANCRREDIQIQAIRMLVRYGADIDFVDTTFGFAPLRTAAFWTRIAMVRELVRLGADPEKRCFKHCTPLHHAAKHVGRGARALLELGASMQEEASFCFR